MEADGSLAMTGMCVMTTTDLPTSLVTRGVHLVAVGDALWFHPGSRPSGPDADSLREHKPAIMRLLRADAPLTIQAPIRGFCLPVTRVWSRNLRKHADSLGGRVDARSIVAAPVQQAWLESGFFIGAFPKLNESWVFSRGIAAADEWLRSM